MTNAEMLRSKIDESGYKIHHIAEKCGLTYQGFLNKVNGKSQFTAPEIKTLRTMLKLSPDDVESIFFTDCVDKLSTK